MTQFFAIGFFLMNLPEITEATQNTIPRMTLSCENVNMPTTVKTRPSAARITVITDAFFGFTSLPSLNLHPFRSIYSEKRESLVKCFFK